MKPNQHLVLDAYVACTDRYVQTGSRGAWALVCAVLALKYWVSPLVITEAA